MRAAGRIYLKVMFFRGLIFYLLSSVLQGKESDDLDVSRKKELIFAGKTIYRIPSSIMNKTL